MKETLTNRQIVFLLFGAIVGFGVIGLPKDVAEQAGTAGWFPLVIATGISIILIAVIIYLGYIFEHKTIYDYSEILVGKFVRNIFSLFYIMYYFLFFTMITRGACEIIKLTILVKTPIWALSFLYMAVVYYAITRGLTGIARLFELFGILIIIGANLVHILIFTEGKFINLRPFFILKDLPVYIKTSATLMVPFLWMELLTVVPMERKNNKKIFKYSMLMMILIGFLYIILVESCISVIGVDDIINYKDAMIATIRRVDLPYLSFLRRVDGIMLLLWIIAVFCTITLFAYGTVFLINKTIKKANFNLISLIVICLSFIAAQIPENLYQVVRIIEFAGYLSIVAAAVIPSFLLIITKVKKYDKKTS